MKIVFSFLQILEQRSTKMSEDTKKDAEVDLKTTDAEQTKSDFLEENATTEQPAIVVKLPAHLQSSAQISAVPNLQPVVSNADKSSNNNDLTAQIQPQTISSNPTTTEKPIMQQNNTILNQPIKQIQTRPQLFLPQGAHMIRTPHMNMIPIQTPRPLNNFQQFPLQSLQNLQNIQNLQTQIRPTLGQANNHIMQNQQVFTPNNQIRVAGANITAHPSSVGMNQIRMGPTTIRPAVQPVGLLQGNQGGSHFGLRVVSPIGNPLGLQLRPSGQIMGNMQQGQGFQNFNQVQMLQQQQQHQLQQNHDPNIEYINNIPVKKPDPNAKNNTKTEPEKPSGPTFVKKVKDWSEYKTEQGRSYFHNSQTNKTVWEKPEEMQTPGEKLLEECIWKATTTKSKDGTVKTYYYNSLTMETTWDMPKEFKNASEKAAELDRKFLAGEDPEVENDQQITEKLDHKNEQMMDMELDEVDDETPNLPIIREQKTSISTNIQETSNLTQEKDEEEKPKTYIYADNEERKDLFMQCLEDHNINSSCSWENALKLIKDELHFNAFTKASDRKQCFNEYKIFKARQEEKNDRKILAEAEDKLIHFLKNHKDMTLKMSFDRAEHMFGDLPVWQDVVKYTNIIKNYDNKSANNNNDFEKYKNKSKSDNHNKKTGERLLEIFDQVLTKLQLDENKRAEKIRYVNIEELSDILREIENVTYQTTWNECQTLLAKNKNFQRNRELQNMDMSDALETFQEYIRELENEHYEDVDKTKFIEKRIFRRNRDKFLRLLDNYKHAGIIKMGTPFDLIFSKHLVYEKKFTNCLGQPGSTALDLYKFFINDLKSQFQKNKRIIIALLKNKKIFVFEDEKSQILEFDDENQQRYSSANFTKRFPTQDSFTDILADDETIAEIELAHLELIYSQLKTGIYHTPDEYCPISILHCRNLFKEELIAKFEKSLSKNEGFRRKLDSDVSYIDQFLGQKFEYDSNGIPNREIRKLYQAIFRADEMEFQDLNSIYDEIKKAFLKRQSEIETRELKKSLLSQHNSVTKANKKSQRPRSRTKSPPIDSIQSSEDRRLRSRSYSYDEYGQIIESKKENRQKSRSPVSLNYDDHLQEQTTKSSDSRHKSNSGSRRYRRSRSKSVSKSPIKRARSRTRSRSPLRKKEYRSRSRSRSDSNSRSKSKSKSKSRRKRYRSPSRSSSRSIERSKSIKEIERRSSSPVDSSSDSASSFEYSEETIRKIAKMRAEIKFKKQMKKEKKRARKMAIKEIKRDIKRHRKYIDSI